MTAYRFVAEIATKGIGMEPDGDAVVLRGPIDDDIVDRVKARKPELLEALTFIRDMAGNEWPEIAANPKQLQAFESLAMSEAMRDRGEVPDHYAGTTTCKHCGPVPIWQGCPAEVVGCPWCLNQHNGRPIPRAKAKDPEPAATGSGHRD